MLVRASTRVVGHPSVSVGIHSDVGQFRHAVVHGPGNQLSKQRWRKGPLALVGGDRRLRQCLMTTDGATASALSAVELDRQQCLELLESAAFGRVVLSVDCIPVALPVNLAVLDGDVVFSTDAGSKLDAAVHGQVVSVEADSIDRVYRTGWSVLVTGVAHLLADGTELDRASRLLLGAWAPGPHPFLIRVPSTLVSGRRLLWGEQHSVESRP